MLKNAEQIFVVNGRKITQWRPSTKNKADILSQVIGRSGNLRAPTIRKNNSFIIGYDETVYKQVLEQT